MADPFQHSDGRARHRGPGPLEVLMFSLGADAGSDTGGTWGINVLKVREVIRRPQITRAPDLPPAVVGMASPRGELVPVIDLARHAGLATGGTPRLTVVIEYDGRSHGLLVAAVDTIVRPDWASLKAPPPMLARRLGDLIIAVTALADGRLAMMPDFETLLADHGGTAPAQACDDVLPLAGRERTVFFADDSRTARLQISRTLDALGVRHLQAVDGRQAWECLQNFAAQATARGKPPERHLNLVPTDAEVLGMDGHVLTRLIRSDRRFDRIPVVMHSSLSSRTNRALGQAPGVDACVAKFDPEVLAETLRALREPASA